MKYNVRSIFIQGYLPKIGEEIGEIILERFKQKSEICLDDLMAKGKKGIEVIQRPAMFNLDGNIIKRKQIYIYTEKHANKYLADFAVAAMMDADYQPIGLDVFAIYHDGRHSYEYVSKFNSQV